MTFTTEITSDKMISDNPIHQRLLKAYYIAQEYVKGDLLEVGCGEGRGVELLSPLSDTYLALDKIAEVIERLISSYPDVSFRQLHVPPFRGIEDNSFDVVTSFQVIEHIKDDKKFLQEIYRVLKPGGKALITTPNIKRTLTRNPWHEREYTAEELTKLVESIFRKVDSKGIAGNERVMEYYEMNRKLVRRITRFDVFNLQYFLPAILLKIPYEIMNRLNRNLLLRNNNTLASNISQEDYFLSDKPDMSLDLFYILYK